MNVSDLFTRLALGELSNLALAGSGVISLEKQPTIVMYANEALLRLHTRFLLREKDLILEMRDGTTMYHLLKRFAYSQYDPDNPPSKWNMPYIMDLGREPFDEDVIKVLSVYDHQGNHLPLNDSERSDSVFTPQSLILQVPFTEGGHTLAVSYQARHPIIPGSDYGNFDIVLPECLESALCAYIASKVFMHMNTAESTAKGQEHSFTFDKLCQEVIEMDLVSTTSSITNTRFQKRGFI
jgi:hypothetical protein